MFFFSICCIKKSAQFYIKFLPKFYRILEMKQVFDNEIMVLCNQGRHEEFFHFEFDDA